MSALLACAMSMTVFLPIVRRWDSAWAPGDMLSTYNNANHWMLLFYAPTNRVGFPGGMNLNLFPGVDITYNAVAAGISAVSGSPFLGINLLVIVSFPVTAALAAIALRIVGLRGWWAVALAVAFTMIPYHFGRALGHAYLSTLYAGVTGVIVALLIGTGMWAHRRSGSPRFWIAVCLLVFVTAWSGVYYAAFGLILAGAAVLWRFAGGASARETLWNLIPVAAIAGVTFVGLVPAAIARFGVDVGNLGQRPAYESVTLAGSLAMALLPAPLSILPRMGYVNEAIAALVADAPFSEATELPNFGTWVTSGSLVLFVTWCIFRVRRGLKIPRDISFLTYLLVILLLFFIPWGVNSIFAEFVTAQIRAWNRLLPLVLLVFILMGGAVLARWKWASKSPWRLAVPSVILLVVLVEQVLPFRSLFADNAEFFGRETDWAFEYAADVNAAIPNDCGIVQLPVMVYPENGAVKPSLNDYEHFWQSLTNPEKMWTYGAVRGSASGDDVTRISRMAEMADISGLVRNGVCGIHVDLRGYESQEARELTRSLTDKLGPPVTTGHRGEWRLFAVAPHT